MSLSRTKLVEKIRSLLAEMHDFMVMGKVRENYFIVHEKADQLPAVIIKDALRWLTAVYEDTFAKVIEVWKLCPPEIWARYATWDTCESFAEVKLLNKRLEAFCHQLKDRTVFFNQRKINAIIKRQS